MYKKKNLGKAKSKYGEICATLNTLSCLGRLTSILNTTKDKKLNGATYVQFRYHQGLTDLENTTALESRKKLKNLQSKQLQTRKNEPDIC